MIEWTKRRRDVVRGREGGCEGGIKEIRTCKSKETIWGLGESVRGAPEVSIGISG